MSSKFIQTSDGSWTVRSGEGVGQLMHTMHGAYGETLHVYGRAINRTLNQDHGLAPRFLIFGLGLGYIEMTLAAQVLKMRSEGKRVCDSLELVSYESESELNQRFVNWVYGDLEDSPESRHFLDAYESFELRIANEFSLSSTSQTPRGYLRELHHQGRWRLPGAFDRNTEVDQLFDCILFDPFSPAQSPEIWEDEFLLRFLKICAAPTSIFATYASNARIKRALSLSGFEIHKEPGFSAKREFILATRSSNR